jgi:hypothetical protein
MDCPFCGNKEDTGNRCLACGMNKDSFNPPCKETVPEEKKVVPIKEVKEVKKKGKK